MTWQAGFDLADPCSTDGPDGALADAHLLPIKASGDQLLLLL